MFAVEDKNQKPFGPLSVVSPPSELRERFSSTKQVGEVVSLLDPSSESCANVRNLVSQRWVVTRFAFAAV